ncbi:MAG: sensor histidine kinase [Planctomycetales bacterium]|nr:sensor histidine kinase [Planctomycetales bacterium]
MQIINMNSWRQQTNSLVEAISESVQLKHSLARSMGVKLELNIDSHVATFLGRSLSPTPSLRAALEDLLELAIRRSPRNSDVMISASIGARGIEIEVADSGSQNPIYSFRPAFAIVESKNYSLLSAHDATPGSTKLVSQIQAAGLQIQCLRCPQGGIAWQLTIPSRMPQRKVA